MPFRVSCPYCNSRFTIPEVPDSGRTACPRCGDAFSLQGRVEEEDRGDVPESASIVRGADGHTFPSFNRRVLLPLALVLGLVGGAGLYLYYGGFIRRSGTGPDIAVGKAGKRPLELAGLGFAPPNSNIVLALQTAPLLRYCERTGQNPQILLSQAGVPQAILGTMGRAGVPLERIDHVAVGVHVPDAPDLGQLRLVIAVVLIAPLDDEDRFLEEVKARSVKQAGKSQYRVELGPLPLHLVRVSATEWVFGWSDEDVRAAERGPPRARLPAPLVEMVEQRVPADSTAWVATGSEDWDEKRSIRKLAEFGYLKREWLAALAKGRAVAAGLSLADEPRLHASVQCRDAETANRLRNFFRERLTDPRTRVGGEGDWAMIDTPVDPQSGFSRLRPLLDEN